jgi:glutamate formiminotransferase / 5-formyltetrahydrofolate cyclo-ligase
MLECVINISEGRDRALLAELARHAGDCLLDLHADAHHNRAVFTLAGDAVLSAAEAICAEAVIRLDLRTHHGVHPRLGVVDVVPFVPIGIPIGPDMDLTEALAARTAFTWFAASELSLPCFLYGPERSLPQIRSGAFTSLAPDAGPLTPDPRVGAVCVGARLPLVAYNLVLESDDLALAKEIARKIRSESIRALGLGVGGAVQVSCNLIEPWAKGPAQCYDAVAAFAPVRAAELVGLIADQVLRSTDEQRWAALDLDLSRTLEFRLEHGYTA